VAEDEGGSDMPGPYRRPDYFDVVVAVGPGEPDNVEFGSLLRILRDHARMSRADAAAKLGLSVEYLRLIEAGKRTPALGQMRSFLEAYDAEGAVESVQPDGSVADLIVMNPETGDPSIVEFRSRIREARRRGRRDTGGGTAWRQDAHPADLADNRHAAELGAVVALLTRAGSDTLRKIRELLEDELG
jgi:transcriptional regulator with XRE-family HTH domain